MTPPQQADIGLLSQSYDGSLASLQDTCLFSYNITVIERFIRILHSLYEWMASDDHLHSMLRV